MKGAHIFFTCFTLCFCSNEFEYFKNFIDDEEGTDFCAFYNKGNFPGDDQTNYCDECFPWSKFDV